MNYMYAKPACVRKMICRRRKFRYIKEQINWGWYLPNTVDVSFKTHIVFKKNRREKTQKQRMKPALLLRIFQRRAWGPVYQKDLLTSAFHISWWRQRLQCEFFRSIYIRVIYSRNIYIRAIYIIGIYIRFSWSSCRASGFICIQSFLCGR